jgi:transposase InsO family protein
MTVDLVDKQDPICEPCLAGKLSAAPFVSSPTRSLQPLELIHSDLYGPFRTSTHDGYRYWITFIDDCTKFHVVILIRPKSDAFEAFKRFMTYAENQLGAKIKALQDNKGGEYMSDAFETFCHESGIIRRHSVRDRPQQNGAA